VLLSLVGEQMSASQRAALAVTHREGLAAISAALMGPDFAQLAHISLQQCRLRIEACAPVLLQRRIKLQAKDYENCLDQAAGNESPTLEQWHERRLIIKQLRYLSLLAAKWLPHRVNQLQIPLKQAKTAIGKLHDAELIAQFLHKKKIKKPLIRKAYKAWNKLMFQRKIEFMVLG
jgi:CHAD domain-containing protein